MIYRITYSYNFSIVAIELQNQEDENYFLHTQSILQTELINHRFSCLYHRISMMSCLYVHLTNDFEHEEESGADSKFFQKLL